MTETTLPSSLNEYQQPVGAPVPGWTARPHPGRVVLRGRYCRLEALDVDTHAFDLQRAFSGTPNPSDWTYLSIGPFATGDAYRAYLDGASASLDPLHFTVIDLTTGRALGTLALMRIDPANGAIEVGFVVFSDELKRRPLTTEAQYLLMRYAFDDLGYRRYEWKCDSLNEPSRKAALRLGFQYEGLFRQATVYKGRNRDTAWFSIVDGEWPIVRQALEAWLAPGNFDERGVQRRKLEDLRESSPR